MQRTDDLNPLSFGEHQPAAAENDVLKDFSDWWGADGLDSPPVHKSPLKLNTSSSRHSVSGEGMTQASETENTSRRTSSASWTSSQQRDDLLSAISIDTDDASRSSVKRRRTATAGFQPLARVKENNVGSQEEEVRPWMVDVRDQDVVLGEL